jgi:putative ABC transport system substrate-binding protein
MLDRRAVVAGLLGVAAAPGGLRAQPKRVPGKIGYLHLTTIDPDHKTLVLLRSVWQERGYVEGESVFLRSAGGDVARLPSLVAELIGLGVGVLIVVGAGPVRAASQVTKTVPIVAIDLETDPVHAGYAASVSRPGGNITGLFMDLPSIAGKWIELLREAVPGIRRAGLIWDRTTSRDQLDKAMAAAQAVGLEAAVIEAHPSNAYDDIFADFQKGKPAGIVQLTAPGTAPTFADVAAAAIRHKLPLITFLKTNAQNGALICYGPVQELYFPRAAVLADRILRGAKVGELPIERPTNFEFIINLGTAKALGLGVPPALLALADEVIE